MGKKSKAPAPDPRIGEAAMLSAQTGMDSLEFMKQQTAITNGWAAEDRNRYKTVFQPLQDKFIQDAQEWDGAARMGARVNEATAGAQAAIGQQQAIQERQQAAMGVSPNSGRAAALGQSSAIAAGLAVAGAGNTARGQVRQEAQAMQANAINMGSGLAVNPGTSMGLSNSAFGAGSSAAMQGFGQQGQLLNQQYQNQMSQWSANKQQSNGLWSGIGNAAGLALGFLSDENAKEDIKPVDGGMLDQIKGLPVSEWTYKKGMGDEGRHIGPMAQDWKKATGRGTGRTIDAIDMMGTMVGAVKELADKVDALEALRPSRRRATAKDEPARRAPTRSIPADTPPRSAPQREEPAPMPRPRALRAGDFAKARSLGGM